MKDDHKSKTELISEIESMRDRINELEQSQLHFHQTEKASYENAKLLQSFAENFQGVVFIVDNNGIFKLSDGRGLADLGLKPGQVVGTSVYEVYKDVPQVEKDIRFALKGNELSSRLVVGPLVFDVNFQPIRDEDRTITGVLGVAINITENYQAGIKIMESEEKFREMAELLPEIIFETDSQGILTFVNKQAFDKFGYSEHDFKKGITALQTLIPEDRNRAFKNIRGILNGKKIGSSEYTALRKDGSMFPVMVYTSPILKENKPVGMRGIIVDMTERRQLEEQLRQSQKMEAVGQLAGGVAHDFNNLLTIINGYCDLLVMRDLPKDVHDPILQIQNAGNRAAQLTSQLLAFSRKQIIQPISLNLNTIIMDYLKMLSRLLGEDIKIMTNLQPELENIKADPTQIEQIIMNVAINARDAMPFGGKLTIETKSVEFDEDYTRNHAGSIPGRFVMLAISDNGIGMDQITQARIFEPFFTTKGRDKGTGLGLATVYGIVKQNNGFIYVYSEPQQGTTFKIYLPEAELRGLKKDPATMTQMELNGRETILLVEDDPGVRQVTGRTLTGYGYRVISATNGEEAIQIYRKSGDSIELLLTDVIMPQMSGPELAETLKAENPKLKILYFSGYTDNSIVHHGVLDEGMDFIQKPFSHVDLARKIKMILQS